MPHEEIEARVAYHPREVLLDGAVVPIVLSSYWRPHYIDRELLDALTDGLSDEPPSTTIQKDSAHDFYNPFETSPS